jgi:hypothetical protein
MSNRAFSLYVEHATAQLLATFSRGGCAVECTGASEFFTLDTQKTSLYSEKVKFFKPTRLKLLFASLLSLIAPNYSSGSTQYPSRLLSLFSGILYL